MCVSKPSRDSCCTAPQLKRKSTFRGAANATITEWSTCTLVTVTVANRILSELASHTNSRTTFTWPKPRQHHHNQPHRMHFFNSSMPTLPASSSSAPAMLHQRVPLHEQYVCNTRTPSSVRTATPLRIVLYGKICRRTSNPLAVHLPYCNLSRQPPPVQV
jgi:hypothetical protein